MHFTTQPANPLSERSENEIPRSNRANVPYFPPPPTSSDTSKKPSRKSKPPFLDGKKFRVPSEQQSRRRSSLRHTTGYSTSARRQKLRDAHLPAITMSSRQWTLLVLILLSFLVLVMGFIFADCVALPHTDKQTGNGTDNLPGASPTLYLRRAATITPAQSESDEAEQLGFLSSRNLAILFFYTATLPFLTIFHALAELTVSSCCNEHDSPTSSNRDSASDDSDSDSITKVKSLNLARKHGLSSNQITQHSETAGFTPARKSRFAFLRAHLPALSLTSSILLIAGWIVVNGIHAHCEIPVPTQPADLAGLAATQQICPVQIRGHFMQGIHQLSIAKNVFGWVLVCVYIGYAVLCARSWGVAGRQAREAQRLKDLESKRNEQLRRSFARKKDTVVRFSLGKQGEVGVTETTQEVTIELDARHARHGNIGRV